MFSQSIKKYCFKAVEKYSIANKGFYQTKSEILNASSIKTTNTVLKNSIQFSKLFKFSVFISFILYTNIIVLCNKNGKFFFIQSVTMSNF